MQRFFLSSRSKLSKIIGPGPNSNLVVSYGLIHVYMLFQLYIIIHPFQIQRAENENIKFSIFISSRSLLCQKSWNRFELDQYFLEKYMYMQFFKYLNTLSKFRERKLKTYCIKCDIHFVYFAIASELQVSIVCFFLNTNLNIMILSFIS